jgi:hypothetical protein
VCRRPLQRRPPLPPTSDSLTLRRQRNESGGRTAREALTSLALPWDAHTIPASLLPIRRKCTETGDWLVIVSDRYRIYAPRYSRTSHRTRVHCAVGMSHGARCRCSNALLPLHAAPGWAPACCSRARHTPTLRQYTACLRCPFSLFLPSRALCASPLAGGSAGAARAPWLGGAAHAAFALPSASSARRACGRGGCCVRPCSRRPPPQRRLLPANRTRS